MSPSKAEKRETKWFRSQVLSRGEGGSAARGVESFEEAVEVVAGELPFERLGDPLVVSCEGEQSLLDGGEVAEVVGLQHLALHDREVDLDLVDPACVDRQVDDNEVGIGSLEEPLAEFPELGTALAGPYEGKRRLVVGRFNVVYEHDRTADQVGIIFIVFSGLR